MQRSITTCSLRRLGCLRVAGVELHPDDLRPDLDGLLDNLWDILRRAKHLYYIDFHWDGKQVGIGFLAQNLLRCGIDWDHPVILALQVCGDAMAVFMRVGG